VVIIYWTILNVGSYKSRFSPIAYDVKYYYSYLPALFIHHDIHLNYYKNDSATFKSQIEPLKAPNGNFLIKMTCGVAIYCSPFFFIAHAYSLLWGTPDGYSAPYKFWLIFGGAFYCCCGLFFLRKILLRYFSENITALTILSICLGSNLFYYAYFEGLISHVYIFFSFVMILWFTLQWHLKPTWYHSLALGFFCGMCLLVRPSDGVIILIPIFYNVYSKETLLKKLELIRNNFSQIVLVAIAFLIPNSLQLWYWKKITDHWIFYSYLGEKFDFLHPNIIEGLFSYQKGWLIYTPIMLFAIGGLFFCYHRIKEFFFPIVFFLICNLYVVFSWWCWWYGGSYGSRSLVESYALLAFPMAMMFEVLSKQKILKWIMLVTVGCFLTLNQIQTFQYRHNILHWDSMTKNAYWYIFMKVKLTDEERKTLTTLLKTPDYSVHEN
jgi:hypothetical protein